jgi:hypothetical protein
MTANGTGHAHMIRHEDRATSTPFAEDTVCAVARSCSGYS